LRSVVDGALVRFTPAKVIEIQAALGADVAMAFDHCPADPTDRAQVAAATQTTRRWLNECVARHRELGGEERGQALFGIVQGGTDAALRVESARRTVALDFDGYGIGGLSVGEPRHELLEALAATVPELPVDRPRYLMGVGDPVGMLESIALGVDQFDCVAPTRAARHGSMWTSAGRLNLRNAANAADDGPIDPDCPCSTCARWSRGYLRHLQSVGEPTAWRLCSIHNLAYVLGLMDRSRAAIATGTLSDLVVATREVWDR